MDFLESIAQYVPCNEQEENDTHSIIRYATVFDDLFTRENGIAHLTASCWIVNKDRSKVLMIYHNIYQSWAWAGGHADGDRDLCYVAMKEAMEETGVTDIRPVMEAPLSIDNLTVIGHMKRGKYVSAHIHLNATYLLEADEDQPLRVKPDENSGVKWVPVDECVALSNEHEMRVVYQKLIDKVNEKHL